MNHAVLTGFLFLALAATIFVLYLGHEDRTRQDNDLVRRVRR